MVMMQSETLLGIVWKRQLLMDTESRGQGAQLQQCVVQQPVTVEQLW